MSRARFAPKSRCSTTLFRLLSAWLWAISSATPPLPVAPSLAPAVGFAGVALETVGDARATRGRDAHRDQDDRQGGDSCDRECHGIHRVCASFRA